MTNPETDKFELVQPILAKEVPGLFKRMLSSKDGFCIEVFRGERHLGSIVLKDEALVSNPLKSFEGLGVRRDDMLYRVNLGGKLFTLEGTFTTSDNLHPGYKVVVELAVTNPSQFITRYHQQDDPMRIALAALEGELRRYAALRSYHRLKPDELSYRIEHTLIVGNNKTIGLDVVRVHDVIILEDPHEQKKREVIHEKEIERTGVVEVVKTDAIKFDFERGERKKDDEEKWQRERREEEEKRFKVRLDSLAEIIMIDVRNRIKDLLDSGYSLQDITQIHPELGMAFPSSPSSSSDGYIDSPQRPELTGTTEHPSFNNEPLHGQVDVDRVSPPQPQLRHLHARFPKRVRVGDRLPLQVRVALSPAPERSAPLRAFSIPPDGADLKLVLECPGFLLRSASIATVYVSPTADSDWVLFELEALHEGVHTLEITAFNGGAFLGTLSLQLTVDSLAVREQSVDYITLLPLRSPQEGEVTLVIRYDPHSKVYRYQFRGTAFSETDELHSGPLQRKQEDAVADLVTLLNGQARGLTGYSTEETRRWLQGKGIELWKELIPKELESLFWQQRENIKWMTILSDGDPMPWEVMYPTNDAGDDAGFLAEQFPIVRWIFGPAPTTQLQCSQPCFVVPDDAPLTAGNELAALRRIMGDGQNINDLTPLLKLFDTAEFDTLHFACHNIFRADSPTSSSIQLGTKRFVPTFLNKYNKHFQSPLVFMNACRSDGMAANYTWLAGWAKSFLAAGAGVFIGSLWEVRDSSASRFAETFYQALHSGIALGDAMKQARTAIQNEPGDPTWLAYTLYGNPAAILVKEPSKRS